MNLDYTTASDAALQAEMQEWTGSDATSLYIANPRALATFSLAGGWVERVIPAPARRIATVSLTLVTGDATITVALGGQSRTLAPSGGIPVTVAFSAIPQRAPLKLRVDVTERDAEWTSQPTLRALAVTSAATAPALQDLVSVSVLVPADGIVLGRAQLNRATARFGSNTETRRWTELTPSAMSITAQRGGERDALGTAIEVGTLTVTLLNVSDPDIRPNAHIRLAHRLTGVTLFTGIIRRVPRTHRRDKITGRASTVTSIIATDAVQPLANTMRYGADIDGVAYERWERRIERLMASSLVPYSVTGTADDDPAHPLGWRRLQGIVFESTLLRHLDLACNSVRARWYVDTVGLVRFEGPFGRPVRPVLAVLSDEHSDHPLHRSYLDIGLEYDTDQVINELRINNHGRELTDSGWQADDVTHGPYRDITSIATWGAVAAEVDTSLWAATGDATPMNNLAAAILAANRTPRERVRTVRLDLTTDPDLAGVDIYDRLTIVRDGASEDMEVTAINHTITTDRWTATLTLKETS